jgi:hypothetical protein
VRPRTFASLGLLVLALAAGTWIAARPPAGPAARGADPGVPPGRTETSRETPSGASRAGLAAAVEREATVRPRAAEDASPDRFRLSGAVVDPEGRPVAQAEVQVHREISFARELTHLDLVERVGTDATGGFETGDLGPGARWLLVAPGSPWAPRVVRLDETERHVRIEVSRGREVVVTVLGPTGAPVRGASVSSRTLDAEDRPRLPPLRPAGSDWTDHLLFRSDGLSRTTDASGVARVPAWALPLVLSVEPPLDLDALPSRGHRVSGDFGGRSASGTTDRSTSGASPAGWSSCGRSSKASHRTGLCWRSPPAGST